MVAVTVSEHAQKAKSRPVLYQFIELFGNLMIEEKLLK